MPSSLAVFIPGWVGDAVMATPALMALRAAHPGWCMIGVGKPGPMAVLDGLDLFDAKIVSAGKGWDKGTLEIASQLRLLKVKKVFFFLTVFARRLPPF